MSILVNSKASRGGKQGAGKESWCASHKPSSEPRGPCVIFSSRPHIRQNGFSDIGCISSLVLMGNKEVSCYFCLTLQTCEMKISCFFFVFTNCFSFHCGLRDHSKACQ